MKIHARYLALAVSTNHALPREKLMMRRDGELVYELDFIPPTENDPLARLLYPDLSPFLGQELTISVLSEGVERPYEATLTDTRPVSPYASYLRPALHFSPRFGWMNDPNGLVYDGEWYHLYFQHNPAGTCWGNMHWGHAVSRDLLRWEELGEALYPDENGAMFSGCGVVDYENVSGLGEGDRAPLLFYYTAAGGTSIRSEGRASEQYLAYSTDGGRTLKKLPQPIVPEIVPGNRDPKVSYAPELGKWVMALYLGGNEYALLTSEDLLHFTLLQRICLPGDSECPDFYPLICAEDGRRLWVLSGASDCYLVGELDGEGFHPIQQVMPGRYTDFTYAAQSYYGIGGREAISDVTRVPRVIKMAWGAIGEQGAEFYSQMNTPTEVTLHLDPDGCYRIARAPLPEALKSGIYDREGAMLTLDASSPAEGSFRGIPYRMDVEASTVTLGGVSVPLSYTGRIDVRMIADTLGIELWCDGGRSYAVVNCRPSTEK